MRIFILCTDPKHAIIEKLIKFVKKLSQEGHESTLVFDKEDLQKGDFLFLVSCSQIIDQNLRKNFVNVLVLHASDLPSGRGWSPHIWSILEGASEITVSLLDAADNIDAGDIWLQEAFSLEGHELLPEINEKLFNVELRLMELAIHNHEFLVPVKQKEAQGSYFNKRTSENSRLDPSKSLACQFNLLRVVDNQRYPAFFEYQGMKYILRIEKVKNE